MKTPESKLSAKALAEALHNTAARVVARMTYEAQRSLLSDLVLGRAMLALDDGAALLEALQVEPIELAKAVQKVEETRVRAVAQAEHYKRRLEIDAAMVEPEAALIAETERLFGEDWQSMRPLPLEIEYQRERVELFNAPLLRPLADALEAAMVGYAEASQFGRMMPDEPECAELLAIVDRRHERAAEQARRIA